MSLTTIDFDEIWMHPTDKGMAFSRLGQEEFACVHLRVFIEATDRSDWWIEEVHMVVTVPMGFEETPDGKKARSREFTDQLEGEFLEAAKLFLYDAKSSELQDRVDLEVLPSWEDLHPYTAVTA